MDEKLLLRDATVQEIHLELLRRTQHNALDGEKVYKSLLAHRELWLSVLLDRPGVPNYANPGFLLTAGLIKLRDLQYNVWNADQLFFLTPTHEDARKLAEIAEQEEWAGEIVVYEDQEEIDRGLGIGRLPWGLLSIWWD